MGWGPIPWLLMSEIFPLHAKGVATGACVLTNWLMAFLVTKEFSSLMVSPGPGNLPLWSTEKCLRWFSSKKDSASVNGPVCRPPHPPGTSAVSVRGEESQAGPSGAFGLSW